MAKSETVELIPDALFPRKDRCLLWVPMGYKPVDCNACRTIRFCPWYKDKTKAIEAIHAASSPPGGVS
jgi:hypothetical protein